MDDDLETHWIDEPAGTTGWALVSVTGARRWRVEGHDGHGLQRAVFVPRGDAVCFSSGVLVDLAGSVIRSSRLGASSRWVLARGGTRAVARPGSHATVSNAVHVIDLASFATIRRIPIDAHTSEMPCISADGRIVSVDGRVLRVHDGELLDEVPHVLSLSDDGALALVKVRSSTLAVRDRSRHELRPIAGLPPDWGVAPAWHGELVAWRRGRTLHIESAGDPSRGVRVEGTFRGEPIAAGVGGDAGFLMGDAQGIGLFRDRPTPIRSYPGLGLPVAATPDGRSALVQREGRMVLLDLASGAVTEVGDRARDPVTRLSWDPLGAGVLVGTLGGALRLWDPASARTVRELPRTSGAVAFTRDGARIVAADADGGVSATTREGAPLWRRTHALPAEVAETWEVHEVVPEDRHDGLVLHVSLHPLISHADRLPDASRVLERVLDPDDGHERALREGSAARMAAARGRPDVVERGVRRADGAEVPLDPALDSPVAMLLSPDRAHLFVGTRDGMLLRFDRRTGDPAR